MKILPKKYDDFGGSHLENFQGPTSRSARNGFVIFSDLELFDHPVSMFKRIYFNMGLNHLK